MNLATFKLQMERLSAQFGKAAYSQGRVDLIWNEVQDMSDTWFVKTVNHFLGSSRHAPLVPEFVMAAQPYRNRSRSSGETSCQYCSGSYWILPGGNVLEVDGPLVVMRCECVGGPTALARYLRTTEKNPDPALADRIERMFSGVSSDQFYKDGWKILRHRRGGKIKSTEMPANMGLVNP